MALDPSMPVLVVDDYSTMVRIIRNLLHQLGFSDVDDATHHRLGRVRVEFLQWRYQKPPQRKSILAMKDIPS